MSNSPTPPRAEDTLRLVTWNINSVRLRQDLVLRLLETLQADILCLQETKVVDALFPRAAFEAAGYPHIAIAGMKGYNGVAILAREEFANSEIFHRCGKEDCRHIAASFAGFDLHNLYIPAGGDVPDRIANEKFAHKLDFVDELTDWWPARPGAGKPAVAVGDFNIAPLETDVWSHKQLLDVVSHTPIEVEKLAAMQRSVDWRDAVRLIHPPEEVLFSWWSYRARDWQASNRGRRLDHIWVTPELAPRVRDAGVLVAARGWTPKPSDHAPVWVDLARAV